MTGEPTEREPPTLPPRGDEDDFDGFAVIQAFALPIFTFVLGGLLLAFLPQAPGPTTASFEMLGLAGLVYTMAMLGKARAQRATEAARRWKAFAIVWGAISLLFVIAIRVVP